jgi:type II secretory pathway pseudopilin PulG
MNAKQKRALEILVTIVAVLALALIIIKQINKNIANANAAAAASSAEAAESVESNLAYTALTYSNGSATLSFAANEDGTWYWVDDPDFPLDGDYITKIIRTISDLSPQQTITDGDTLDAYGLTEPSMTLTATAGDGTETVLTIGNQVVSDETCYYLLMNGDESTVYIVTDSLYNELSNSIYDMMLLPETPMLSEGMISSIDVTGAAETHLTSSVDTSSAGSSADSSTDSSEDQASVEVTWRSSGANVTSLSTVSDLVAEVSAITLKDCQDFKPSASAVTLCGFDAPKAVITVHYTDEGEKEQTLTLTVGNTTADGTGRFVRINDDTTVYSMASESLTAVLTVADSGLGA